VGVALPALLVTATVTTNGCVVVMLVVAGVTVTVGVVSPTATVPVPEALLKIVVLAASGV
jgi:hypothetical protein